ncbi:sulfatase-like hydrolase/transferase [Paenibacillus sp. IITD108]|uniref:sulfatase-like hydrolase/transferase n=1 Tax=Paenibacillus sp. IITD108 TaxID=3116649 RepID=UPI002F424F7B
MKKPNILLFVTDQQHASTISEHGPCRMPNLNRLMIDGVKFDHAYTPTPMCTPARSSLVTGLYPHQHKLIYNHSDESNYSIQGIETIGSALAAEGYRTAYAGKWHIGNTPPMENGFREELTIDASPQETVELRDVVSILDRGGQEVIAAAANYDASDSYVFRVTRSVNKWLSQLSSEEPFLLMVSCIEPHVPWIVPEPYASMYDPAILPEWDSYRDNFDHKPMTYTKHYTKENFCRLQDDWPSMSRALAKYYGLVSMIDDAFGTILTTLENQDLMDNTIILFTSDHGELLGKHALIGKNELALDDIIRVPLVVYGKGRFSPGARHHFISLCDVFNTVMELAGAQLREHLDSRSFISILNNEPAAESMREEVVIQHHGTLFPNMIRAIRTSQYKYVFRAHELDELYDLELDPSERVNRIHDPAYVSVIQMMRIRLLEWARHNNDFVLKNMEVYFQNPYDDSKYTKEFERG